MLRQLATRSLRLTQLGMPRHASTAAQQEGNSIAQLIASVNSSSPSSLLGGGLTSLKSSITPGYGSQAGSSEGMSLTAKLFLGAAAGWFLYRADTQARSKDWIVDLSLNVLQAAWLISFASFIPFRSVYLSLRSIAPHTATPLNALRPAVHLK